MTSANDNPSQGRGRTALAVTAVAAVYLAALVSVWTFLPGTLGNVDATAKFWQVDSLLDGHSRLTYAAQSLDPDGRFIPDWYVVRIDAQPRTVYLNPFVFLVTGAAWLAGRIAWTLVPLSAGIVTVLLVAWMARRRNLLPQKDRWMLLAVTAAGTPIFYYALVPLEHVLAAAFAAGAFLLASDALADARGETPKSIVGRLAASGACLALAALSRGECYLLALSAGLVVMALLWSSGRRRIIAAGASMLAGGGATLAAWFLVNPLGLRMQWALAEQGTKTPTGLLSRFWHLVACVHPGTRLASLLGDPVALAVSVVGGAALLAALGFALAAGTRRSWRRHVATALLAAGLAVALLSWTNEGLLAVCPLVLLAAFLGRKDEGLGNPASALVLWTSALFVALCVALLPNAGATQFGPRFLVPVLAPLVAVSFALVRRRAKSEPGRWLAAMLALAVVCSLAAEAKGIVQLRRAGQLSRQTEAELSKLPSPFVVFSPGVSSEFTIYRATSTFLSRPVLQVKDEKDLQELLALVKSHGARSVTLLTRADRARERLAMLAEAGVAKVVTLDLPDKSRALVVGELP